jgi:hypothetical protein
MSHFTALSGITFNQDLTIATGSRIRLIFPRHFDSLSHVPCEPVENLNICKIHELMTLVEPCLKSQKMLLMAKGMLVQDMGIFQSKIQFASGVGCVLWIDFRGNASPRLTANRTRALEREDVENWTQVLEGVFDRWKQAILEQIQNSPEAYPLLRHSILGIWDDAPQYTSNLQKWNLTDLVSRYQRNGLRLSLANIYWLYLSLCKDRPQNINVNLVRDSIFHRDLVRLTHYAYQINRLQFAIQFARTIASIPNQNYDISRSLDFMLACVTSDGTMYGQQTFLVEHPSQFHTVSDELMIEFRNDKNLNRSDEINIAQGYLGIRKFSKTYSACIMLHLINEMFYPSLENSWSPLGLFDLRGNIGNALLTSPTSLVFEKESDGRTLCFADSEEHYLGGLKLYHYDLIFPLTVIPVGRLRKTCSKWRNDRNVRHMGVFPFLFLGHVTEVLLNSGEGVGKWWQDFWGVPTIHALIPEMYLWDTPFDDWTEENLRNDCWSATWDIETMRVVWARGAHTMEEMLHGGVGKPFEEFIASEPD